MIVRGTCCLIICLIFGSSWSQVPGVKERIQDFLANMEVGLESEVYGAQIVAEGFLNQYYQNRSYQPVWNDLDYAFSAVDVIGDCENEGLQKEDYHYSELVALRNVLKTQSQNEYLLAQFELLLTDGVINYAYHLLNGKVNPENFEFSWNYSKRKPLNPDTEAALTMAIESGQVREGLDRLRPDMDFYRFLIGQLERYRRIAAGEFFPEISISKALKPGMESEMIPLIRKRLYLTGLVDQIGQERVYDSALAEAVMRFQNLHSIDHDGIIGKRTVDEMNVPAHARVDQIRVNLERMRWVQGSISDNFLVVNIAGFELYLLRDGELVWKTDVMTGAVDTETPVFTSTLKYVVFNPTWTVPRSIIRKSMIRRIKEDPSYLTRNNYKLVNRSGDEVDPASLDLDELSIDNFPYYVVQQPGPSNALGRVKFIFPNEWAIYLHDTPSRHLFTKSERAFSHGCIRVQHPLELAEILLEDPQKWNQKTIPELIEEGSTKTVFLPEPLDVLLMYWTASPTDEEEGFVKFSQDVYSRDQKLLKALNQTPEQ